ncbi:hypothetical protein BDA96_01G412100 [Sorghum bicolor]|uniref:Uncharacterized protein n=1 Tax=Sorghum bicolor TaxID=4558 RepID=A0A921V0M1_SORBI|nr:hypothetical protein BDA96_01G412100 [Sorghum bicolor]
MVGGGRVGAVRRVTDATSLERPHRGIQPGSIRRRRCWPRRHLFFLVKRTWRLPHRLVPVHATYCILGMGLLIRRPTTKSPVLNGRSARQGREDRNRRSRPRSALAQAAKPNAHTRRGTRWPGGGLPLRTSETQLPLALGIETVGA